jgi:hypothetical protein
LSTGCQKPFLLFQILAESSLAEGGNLLHTYVQDVEKSNSTNIRWQDVRRPRCTTAEPLVPRHRFLSHPDLLHTGSGAEPNHPAIRHSPVIHFVPKRCLRRLSRLLALSQISCVTSGEWCARARSLQTIKGLAFRSL